MGKREDGSWVEEKEEENSDEQNANLDNHLKRESFNGFLTFESFNNCLKSF